MCTTRRQIGGRRSSRALKSHRFIGAVWSKFQWSHTILPIVTESGREKGKSMRKVDRYWQQVGRMYMYGWLSTYGCAKHTATDTMYLVRRFVLRHSAIPRSFVREFDKASTTARWCSEHRRLPLKYRCSHREIGKSSRFDYKMRCDEICD